MLKKTRKVLVAGLDKVSEGCSFSMHRFISLLRNRGLELTIVDGYEPTDCLCKLKQSKGGWPKACGRSSGCSQSAVPVLIFFSSPFLLHDAPFAHTLVNSYTTCEYSVEVTVKAFLEKFPLRRFHRLTLLQLILLPSDRYNSVKRAPSHSSGQACPICRFPQKSLTIASLRACRYNPWLVTK